MEVYFAKGSSGGRSSSSSRSSSSKSSSSGKSSSSSKSTTPSPAPKPTPPPAPKTGKSTASPGSTVKTADGKTVTSSTTKPSNIKNARSTGVVGDNGYAPKFKNGYTAPPGSVVYYQQHSMLDYLPWIYLFSVMGDSPRNDQATVVQPDNKQVTVPPEKGGLDGLFILNWILLIIIIGALIVGIVYLVNKITKTTKREKYAI